MGSPLTGKSFDEYNHSRPRAESVYRRPAGDAGIPSRRAAADQIGPAASTSGPA